MKLARLKAEPVTSIEAVQVTLVEDLILSKALPVRVSSHRKHNLLRQSVYFSGDLFSYVLHAPHEPRITKKNRIEVKVKHFLNRRLRFPLLLDDSIGGNRVSRSVFTILTMDEDRPLVRIGERLAERGEENNQIRFPGMPCEHGYPQIA